MLMPEFVKWYCQGKNVRIELRILSIEPTKIHLWGCHLSLVGKATEIFGISCSARTLALALHYKLYHSHASDEVLLFFPVEKNHRNTISSRIKMIPN